MYIENPSLLKEFRTPGKCELCGKWFKAREAHHLRAKGMGGNGELTVRINLVCVGSSIRNNSGRNFPACKCHRLAQCGKIPADVVLAIVAERETCKPEEITEVMDWMQRTVKPTAFQLLVALEDLSPGAKLLAERELTDAGLL